MHKIKILKICFKNSISQSEVECFRGAVVHSMEQTNDFFHNHLKDGKLRYSYPLIQYKRIRRRAAIVCIGEGAEVVGDFFSNSNFEVRIGQRDETLEVEEVNASQVLVQIWDSMFTYHIRKWLPLNKDNYEKYMALESVADKCLMLERLLVGNILSFAKGMGIHFEGEVECKITDIEEPVVRIYKGVKMMAFDAEFKTNVSLPDYIGLGKGVSLGMGTVVRKYEKKDKR